MPDTQEVLDTCSSPAIHIALGARRASRSLCSPSTVATSQASQPPPVSDEQLSELRSTYETVAADPTSTEQQVETAYADYLQAEYGWDTTTRTAYDAFAALENDPTASDAAVQAAYTTFLQAENGWDASTTAAYSAYTQIANDPSATATQVQTAAADYLQAQNGWNAATRSAYDAYVTVANDTASTDTQVQSAALAFLQAQNGWDAAALAAFEGALAGIPDSGVGGDGSAGSPNGTQSGSPPGNLSAGMTDGNSAIDAADRRRPRYGPQPFYYGYFRSDGSMVVFTPQGVIVYPPPGSSPPPVPLPGNSTPRFLDPPVAPPRPRLVDPPPVDGPPRGFLLPPVPIPRPQPNRPPSDLPPGE